MNSMPLIRGVLLAGRFRTHHELNRMSNDDQRNTLIVELSGRLNQSNFQSFKDLDLAGAGAILVLVLTARIRTDQQLKTMSADDLRNVIIVEIDSQTHLGVHKLQSLSNIDLVLLGLGHHDQGVTLTVPSYIRGVLLAGKFRTQHELNRMSSDDQRNTLIVELTSRSNQSNFQSFNDFDLAGAGAVLVFLRTAKIRTDQQLKTLSADDHRNIMIVEIDNQTDLGGHKLQSLRNMDLVLLGLGFDPKDFFKPLPGPLHPLPSNPFCFSIDSIEILTQKTDNDHSDSDWLTIIVTIANFVTKNTTTFPGKTYQIGGKINTGNIIRGPFLSDPINAGDFDVVIINYLITNLGSSDEEDQFKQAVEVTNKVVGIVAPIAGGIIGTIFGNPSAGIKIGQAISEGFDTLISALSDVFDFFGIHVGPANCNGEVLHDTLTYEPNQLLQALYKSASRQYTGPQENDRCGSPPVSKVTFSVQRLNTF